MMLKNFIKCCLFSIISLIVFAFLYTTVFYRLELYYIKYKLSNIENTKILNIWGHDDITLEEITARILIENKGEIVLANLSDDVKKYPQKVIINEIGGYSFDGFYDYGQSFSSYLDVGKNSDFYNKTKIEFNNEKDVIQNYDTILNYVKNLNLSPNINKIDDGKDRYYLLVNNQRKKDLDPIYELYEVDNKVEFAKKLDWNFSK